MPVQNLLGVELQPAKPLSLSNAPCDGGFGDVPAGDVLVAKATAAPAPDLAEAHRTIAASGVGKPGAGESPVKSIEVKFRPAFPQVPNAMHAFIEIDRADGRKQVLGAYPVGGSETYEGGQLTFIANHETKDVVAANDHAYALRPPAGMSLTAYGDSLVAGAKAYTAHAQRYDGLGENPGRYNSNSFVSSLIVAKGGKAGIDDVERIARNFDAGKVGLDHKSPMTDDASLARTIADKRNARLTMTGWGHIQKSSEFDSATPKNAATAPPHTEHTNIATSALPVVRDIMHDWMKKIMSRMRH